MFVPEPDTSSFVEITSVTVIRVRSRREEESKVSILRRCGTVGYLHAISIISWVLVTDLGMVPKFETNLL